MPRLMFVPLLLIGLVGVGCRWASTSAPATSDVSAAEQSKAIKQIRVLLRIRETGSVAVSGSIATIALSAAEEEADPAVRKNLTLEAALKGLASVEVDSISEVAVSGDKAKAGTWTKSPDGYGFVITKEKHIFQAGASSIMGSSNTVSIEETWKLERAGQTAPLGEWKCEYDFEKPASWLEKEERAQRYLNVVKEKVEPCRRPVLSALRALISNKD